MVYVVANIIVLIFEVLYYSMFMYFSKKEGKFCKYILLFSLITISGLFIKTNNLISYLYLVLAMLFGIKYIVKVKTTLYDMFYILVMLLLKLIIEFTFCMILYILFKNTFISIIISNIVKLSFILLSKNNINNFYLKLKKKWDNNNFYIRYIFSCFTYVYVIVSVLFIIFR